MREDSLEQLFNVDALNTEGGVPGPDLAESAAAKPEQPPTLNAAVAEDPIRAVPFTTARITGLRSLPRLDAANEDLPFMTDNAWEAIQSANEDDPYLFVHGGVPCRIEQQPEKGEDGRIIPVAIASRSQPTK